MSNEMFSMALGQNSPAMKKAVANLPDPNQYFSRHNTYTVNVVMYNADHGISPLDRVDVMFKAELENELDPRGARHWTFVKMKPRSVLEGYKPEDYGIVPIRYIKGRRIPVTAGAQTLMNIFSVPQSEVDGSGPKGKIMKKDVLTYLLEEMELTEEEIEAKRLEATGQLPKPEPKAVGRPSKKAASKVSK